MASPRRGFTLALTYLCVSAAAGAAGPLFSASSAILGAHLLPDAWRLGKEAGLGVRALAQGEWDHAAEAQAAGVLRLPAATPLPETPEPCTLTHTASGGLSIVCAEDALPEASQGGRRRLGELAAEQYGMEWLAGLGGPEIAADLPQRVQDGLAHALAWGGAATLAAAALHHARNGGATQVMAIRRAAEDGVGELAEDEVEDAAETAPPRELRRPRPANRPPTARVPAAPARVHVWSRAPFPEDVPPA